MEQNYKYFQDEVEEKKTNKVFYKFIIAIALVYLAIFAIVYSYHANFEYVTINGPSMQNTLNPNPELRDENEVQDGVIVKLSTDADYGDIIVIDRGEKVSSIIKRALAFEGDYFTIASIDFNGGRDYRFMRIKAGTNEVEIINEPYIKSYEYWNMIEGYTSNGIVYEGVLYPEYTQELHYSTTTFDVKIDGQTHAIEFFKVPEGEVFYMGDNRTASLDARVYGTTKQSNIYGYVVKIVHNGTFIKDNPVKWFFQQIGDFFEVIWREILIFFGMKA